MIIHEYTVQSGRDYKITKHKYGKKVRYILHVYAHRYLARYPLEQWHILFDPFGNRNLIGPSEWSFHNLSQINELIVIAKLKGLL